MNAHEFNAHGFREGDAVKLYSRDNDAFTVRLIQNNALVDESGRAWIAGTEPYSKIVLQDIDRVELEGNLENSH